MNNRTQTEQQKRKMSEAGYNGLTVMQCRLAIWQALIDNEQEQKKASREAMAILRKAAMQ